MAHRIVLRTALLSMAVLVLAACASGGRHHPASGRGGAYKVGPPYQAGGVWYYPKEQPNYDKIGIASWYGADFHGRRTANGERFDMDAISAAHTTLPIPSIVEVTNLENGRSIRVRVNDRGPFVSGRIIDLSHAGAMALGFAAKGTAKVRVRYVGPAPLDADTPQTVAVRTVPIAPAPAAPVAAPAYAPAVPPQPALPPGAGKDVGGWGAGFLVQAGAFSDRANAERVLERLRAAGPATIRLASRDGAWLYRVLVGPWDDEAEAESALQRVSELGFTQARVVRF